MHKDITNYLERVRSQSATSADLSNIPKWLESNTRHPLDVDMPWSFKDHEYQIDILKDTADDLCAQKCSQVGASELWVRLLLALAALSKSMTVIYVLPTTGFARKFSKGRIDPIISSSEVLRGMVNKDVDSSELKQLGNSFLYIAGSYGQNSAISVPAQGLFQDEVDFCNQATLTTFNSRLGHNKPGEFYKRSFSTPTVRNYGISKLFEASRKSYYTVRCGACKDWVALDFLRDVEVPGFDGNLSLFTKEDLLSEQVKVSEAMMRCPSCKQVIPQKTLCDPSQRRWVAMHPGRSKAGYQIAPFDVPEINPIARTIYQIDDYDRKKDWANFKVGVPYEDAESTFLVDLIKDSATYTPLPTPPKVEDEDEAPIITPLSSGAVFGLDVGKVSWFTLLVPCDGIPVVRYAERIVQDGNNYLGKRVLHLCRVFGVVRGVVDAGPDISVSKYLVDHADHGKVWACYYARTPKGHLDILSYKEEEQVVTAFRTGSLDELVKRVNGGTIRYAQFPDFKLHMEHLEAMKRVSHRNDAGEEVVAWISTKADHYCHSLNYANMAWNMKEGVGGGAVKAVPCLTGVASAKMGKVEDDPFHEREKQRFASRYFR